MRVFSKVYLYSEKKWPKESRIICCLLTQSMCFIFNRDKSAPRKYLLSNKTRVNEIDNKQVMAKNVWCESF